MASVQSVLRQTAGAPDPVVHFTGFGASSLDFAIKFWTAEAEAENRVKSEVGLAVYAALTEAGIQIPFPQQDLYVKSMPAAGPRETPQGAPEAPQAEALITEP